MKKSCDRCKALNSGRCFFGHKTETYDICGLPVGAKPKEDCPKPTTIKKYVELLQNQYRAG